MPCGNYRTKINETPWAVLTSQQKQNRCLPQNPNVDNPNSRLIPLSLSLSLLVSLSPSLSVCLSFSLSLSLIHSLFLSSLSLFFLCLSLSHVLIYLLNSKFTKLERTWYYFFANSAGSSLCRYVQARNMNDKNDGTCLRQFLPAAFLHFRLCLLILE